MLLRLINRRTLFLLMMAGAVGVPYAALNKDWPKQIEKVKQQYFSKSDKASLSLRGSYEPPQILEEPGKKKKRPSATLVGPQIHRLDEVLRFDATPDWVTQNWSRVSPFESGDMYAMRVPLVTGGNEDDLAGSLTYYFDDRQQVQRITFRGVTGNEQKLVALVTNAYKLHREPSRHPGLYVARWNRRPVSVLRIEHAPVVHQEARLSQKQVHMEVNRPRAYLRMSPEMENWMAAQQPSTQKWRW